MTETKAIPLSVEEVLRQIQQKNYANLPVTIPKGEINSAVDDFFRFLDLPQEVKNKFQHKLDIKNHGSETGYARKSTGQGDLDNKEFFHFTPYTEDAFRHLPEMDLPEVRRFFASAKNIHNQVTAMVATLLDVLAAKYPGIKEKFFSGNLRPFFYLRFLKYGAAPKGEFLAKGHYDRGTMTLAIAESAPGLRIGRDESTLRPVERGDGEVIFMPGYRLQDITSPEDFPPAWHDVVQKSDHQYRPGAARWAVVFFADMVDQNHTPWEEVHKPMG